MLWLNSANPPTDDLRVRQAIAHAINKGMYAKDVPSSLEQPAAQLFPYNAPYCNLDLQPKLSYDPEKAYLLNCAEENIGALSTGNSGDLSTGAKVGIGIGIAVDCCRDGYLSRC